MNKTNAIQLHLIEKGSITSWEAIQEYGATRLSAIIFNLRHKRNMNIRNERVYFTDRYGTPSHYDIYIFMKRIKRMKKIRNVVTDKQLDFLQKLKEFIDINGYTPTVRELGKYVGFSSPATIYWYLKKLEQYELIEIKNHRHIIIKEMSAVKDDK